MAFSSGSGKSRMVQSEINVTPLVDVMLVLLIMFMVTAPLSQQGIEVELPKTSSAGVTPQEDPFVLVIAENRTLTIGKERIAMNSLKDKLKAIFAQRKDKQVYVQADKRVDYGAVAEAMAEIRAAGISSIGLITIPKEQ